MQSKHFNRKEIPTSCCLVNAAQLPEPVLICHSFTKLTQLAHPEIITPPSRQTDGIICVVDNDCFLILLVVIGRFTLTLLAKKIS
ncbi:MAG: hypothetical protein KJ600_04050 [Nanoarchaeota archaeon]|nr:hypothetical protein [Nanoarchaeota archaeon]MBU1103700.1 hypothetical protein [Nanoarchaeota archaeon]